MVKEWELDSIPEKSPYSEQRVENAEGTVTIILEFREIGVSPPLEDDDVFAFIDKDGRRMFIGYDSEGAYKYPA